MTKKALTSYIKKLVKQLKTLPVVLVLFGLVGLTASIAISEEKFALIKNPGVELACDLNPVYSCGKVIDSDQSSLIGVSNEIIGIVMFSVLLTTGVMVLAGAKPKPVYWRVFMAGMLGFMLSVVWLFYQSVYVIGNLCILCTMIWFSGWLITTRGFAWMFDEKLITASGKAGDALAYIRKNIVGFWLVLIMIAVGLVLEHFWYYYGQYF